MHLFISSQGGSLTIKGLWVACLLLADNPAQLYVNGLSVIRTFNELKRTRGMKNAQDLFKAACWATKKRLAGDPLPKEALHLTRVSFDKYGFPLYLPLPLRLQLRTNNPRLETRVLSIFLLSIYLVFTGKRKVDFSNITQPSSARHDSLKDFERLVPTLLSLLGITEAIDLRKPTLITTNRAGPNGHALLACHLDAAAWVLSQDSKQLESWLTGIWPKAGAELFSRITHLGKLRLSIGPIPSKLKLGMISVKREPVKNRLFAISDYWTQVAVRPLHDSLMDLLSKIEADCTYDQLKGVDRIRQWSSEGKPLWSYDLTAATDRFPKIAQASMLNHLLRSYQVTNLGNTWSALLTNRAYLYDNVPLKYSAGQPMGTLSSWAAFTLCHHMMVQWASLKTGRTSRFRDYVLLGDDIVIANKEVAEAYVALISDFGVKVNRSKSICAIGGAEFAKRTFVQGEELTKYLTWRSFSTGISSSVAFFSIIRELATRRVVVPWERLLAVVLGPPSNSKIGKGLRNLLVALIEPGGPIEEVNLWRESSGSIQTVQGWMNLAGGLGNLPTLLEAEECQLTAEAQANGEDLLKLAHASIRLRKAGGYRLQLLGYEMAESLKGVLDSVLAGQLQDAEVRFAAGVHSKVDKLDFTLTAVAREGLLKLSEIHPAREVLEEGLNPLIYTSVPQQLRVLSTSDTELLTLTRDEVNHSVARQRASKYEVESEKELFF